MPYTLALLVVMNAAGVDGLVSPSLFRQTVASAGSRPTTDGWRMLSRYGHLLFIVWNAGKGNSFGWGQQNFCGLGADSEGCRGAYPRT